MAKRKRGLGFPRAQHVKRAASTAREFEFTLKNFDVAADTGDCENQHNALINAYNALGFLEAENSAAGGRTVADKYKGLNDRNRRFVKSCMRSSPAKL